MLPGYVFLPAPADCGLVEDAPGARRFIRYGSGDIAELSQKVIDRIKEMEIEARINEGAILDREGKPFEIGQQVHVSKLELTGKILKLDGRRRIVVEVPLFGNIVPMVVGIGDIAGLAADPVGWPSSGGFKP